MVGLRYSVCMYILRSDTCMNIVITNTMLYCYDIIANCMTRKTTTGYKIVILETEKGVR